MGCHLADLLFMLGNKGPWLDKKRYSASAST
jgi:hypothetical protein